MELGLGLGMSDRELENITESFVPTDIGGCVLWLRGDLGITKDESDRVSVWVDQSGEGNNLSQAASANQASSIADVQNGLPAIRFVADDFYTCAESNLLSVVNGADTPSTIFMVWYPTAVGCPIMIRKDAGDAAYFVNFPDANTIAIEKVDDVEATVHEEAANVKGFDEWTIASLIHNGTKIWLYQDGALSMNGLSFDVGTLTVDLFILGALTTGPSNGFDGDLLEVICYDSALSASNRQSVETYIKNKYDL